MNARPSRRFFLNKVRTINKYITNRFTLWLARRGLGPFSIIIHIGHKSGREYRTPVLATFVDDKVFIPLSYGEGVDWLRNIIEKGACTIRWKDEQRRAANPLVLEAYLVLPHLPQHRRATFERFDIEKFLRLELHGNDAD